MSSPPSSRLCWHRFGVVVAFFLLRFHFVCAIPANPVINGTSRSSALILPVERSEEPEVRVWLTVSSFWFVGSGSEALRGLQSRHLELNWEPRLQDQQQRNGEGGGGGRHLQTVALLTRDPERFGRNLAEASSETGLVLSRVTAPHHPEGYFRTNVSFGKPRLPGGWDRSDLPQNIDENTPKPSPGVHCLPYWAAGYDANGNLLTFKCLKIRPTWMRDHKNLLRSARVAQLALPGTHNSGCFYGSEESLARRNSLSRFIFTQDEDVWEQLVWGIRYLDIRVGYYRDSGDVRLWINHGPMRVTPLEPILRDVRKFLMLSPGEVVILDFHRFPIGFHKTWNKSAMRHRRLANMIRTELGDLAAKCTPNGSPRLDDLWKQGKTGHVIIMHAERGEVHTNWPADWLCSSMVQAWGNQHSVAGLEQYLQGAVTRYSIQPKLWAAMAELTPTSLDLMLWSSRGLRLMADDVNRHVTRWVRDLWWRDVNVVATDFMLGNNIIDVAIEANLKRQGGKM